MSFERAVAHVLMWEGEDSWDAAGGTTRWGISKAAFPDVDVANLTKEAAIGLYLDRYWKPAQCSRFPDPVAFALFDTAVNVGVSQAVKILQRAVGIRADGVVGPQTITTVNSIDPHRVVRDFTLERLQFYMSLSTYSVYGKGWLRRTIDTAMRSA